jgi:hypothetical protein
MPMRILACCTVLALAAPARADSFVDIFGGMSIPIGDDDWERTVDESPKIGVRVGAFPDRIGGFLQADWTPVNQEADEGPFPGGETDISAHRFRMLAGAMLRHPISNTLVFSGRAGLGIDIAYASVSGNIAGFEIDESETDAGLAVELGAGLWFKAGSVEVGGEVGLPMAFHDDDNQQIDFVYNSYDLDLLVGVRFVSQ